MKQKKIQVFRFCLLEVFECYLMQQLYFSLTKLLIKYKLQNDLPSKLDFGIQLVSNGVS